MAPVNLVHQEDCLAIIGKIIKKNCWGQTINVCAGEHPIRQDLYNYAARVLGLDPPIFKTSNSTDFKIVDNTYSRKILGYEYKFNDPSKVFTKDHPGKVMIVGAGPGDKKLLTVKAQEAIKEADVILYDNLVPREIMQLAENNEKYYVGRKFGDQTDQQDRQKKINELLHHHYKQGKNVVRLKCGDPYIYGRAAEEARYLMEHNIRFEIIPGISAALAAASLNNVPVTERNRSNALMICTAHTADYSFEQVKEMASLLKAGNTLAIYMASKSLDKLIPKLIEACGDDAIPITALSNVSRKNEQVVCSTLRHIKKEIEMQQLPTPIVFLAGAKPIETWKEGVLFCGHGSRRKSGTDAFKELIAIFRQRYADYEVDYGFLEFNHPLYEAAVERLYQKGVRKIYALPVILFAGSHAKNDIPYELNTIQSYYSDLTIVMGRPIGVSSFVLDLSKKILTEKEKELSPVDRRETCLLVIGRGTTDPDSNADVHKLCSMTWEGMGYGFATVGYSGTAYPSITDSLQLIDKLGFKRTLVIPFFFFTGVLLERIYAVVEEFNQQSSSEYVYTRAFGTDEYILKAFDERFLEAREGTGNMNCQLCKYRKQIIGFEEAKGTDQIGHHLNVKGILFEEDEKPAEKKGVRKTIGKILGI